MDQVVDVNLQASEGRTAKDLRNHLDPVGLQGGSGLQGWGHLPDPSIPSSHSKHIPVLLVWIKGFTDNEEK